MLLERDSNVVVGTGTIRKLPAILKALGNSTPIIIADQIVAKLHAVQMVSLLNQKPPFIEIPSGERAKDLRTAQALYGQLIRHGATRSTPIIALGGGVTTDLAGYVASTFMRGLPLVLIPTSLLAQVDASIGGKTGVNLKAGKNLIGTFYPALATIIDFDFLATLPASEIRSGFAEVIKMCMLAGEKAFRDLEKFSESTFDIRSAEFQSLASRSISGKIAIVKKDPRETTGDRALLNLGHTFAHGLEAATGYKRYSHGEAVAVGLAAACRLAESVTGFSPTLTARVRTAISRFGLPVSYSKVSPEKIVAAMAYDKKREASLRFVLPKILGKVEICANIPNHLVLKVLKELRA